MKTYFNLICCAVFFAIMASSCVETAPMIVADLHRNNDAKEQKMKVFASDNTPAEATISPKIILEEILPAWMGTDSQVSIIDSQGKILFSSTALSKNALTQIQNTFTKIDSETYFMILLTKERYERYSISKAV